MFICKIIMFIENVLNKLGLFLFYFLVFLLLLNFFVRYRSGGS